jgi:hypothetical protein
MKMSNTINTTRIGRKWELWAHKYLFPTAKLMTNINRNAPYDLDLDGARINVKASKLFTKKHGKYFQFLLKHTHDGCDYFLCVGYRYRYDKEPVKVWLIPSCTVTDKYRLTIGPNHTGQWAEFEREFSKKPNNPKGDLAYA